MEIHYYTKTLASSLNELNGAILSYIGAFALFMLVFSGVYYALSNGNPNMQANAKRAAAFAVIGLIIAILSYAIIVVIEQIAT